MRDFGNAGHPDFYDLPLLAQERLENYLRTKMLLSKL